VLTAEQAEEFERSGFVRLSGVFSEADAVRMRERVWAALASHHGMRQAAPETWTIEQPRHFQALSRAGVFDAVGSPRLTGAIDDLLGSDTWHAPSGGSPCRSGPRPHRGTTMAGIDLPLGGSNEGASLRLRPALRARPGFEPGQVVVVEVDLQWRAARMPCVCHRPWYDHATAAAIAPGRTTFGWRITRALACATSST